MRNQFYLYIDNFSFSDCATTNSILSNSLVPNKKGNKTISRNTQDFLFITHSRLCKEVRNHGIIDQLVSWPVTLELCFESIEYKKFPVIFVNADGAKKKLKFGDLKDYDEQKHKGCYILQEIPFSMISGIYFEDESQLRDSDKSVFPDFLWREEYNHIIDNTSFNESIELSYSDEEIRNAIPKKNRNDETIYVLDKYKAATLQFVNGTRYWHHKGYITSFDSSLLQYFGIKIEDVKAILSKKEMVVPEDTLKDTIEKISLVPKRLKEDSTEQGIYNSIVNVFLTNRDKCIPVTVNSLMNQIKEKFTSNMSSDEADEYIKTIDDIEKYYLNVTGIKIDEVLKRIDDKHTSNSVLKALLFTIKNAEEFDKLVLSLKLYNVDSLTYRRAMVLWGFLNGMSGIPAYRHNRENNVLWKCIEHKISDYNNSSIKIISNDYYKESESSFGIDLTSELVVSFEEVYACFSKDIKQLNYELLQGIYNTAKNVDKKLFKEERYIYYDCSELSKEFDDIKTIKGNKILKEDINHIENLVKKLKKNQKLDEIAVYEDYVLKKDNFNKIWSKDSEELKRYFIKKGNL